MRFLPIFSRGPCWNQIGGLSEHPDVKRRTLLERLAAFGMSRQDEAGHGAPERPAMPQLGYQPAPTQRPAAPGPVHAEYAKRPVAHAPHQPQRQPLDQHGRMAPQRHNEDDQLEIPAFLRRQSN